MELVTKQDMEDAATFLGEFNVDPELIHDLAQAIADGRRHRDRFQSALQAIASLSGKTILGPVDDVGRWHELGANAAFEQAADLASAALRDENA